MLTCFSWNSIIKLRGLGARWRLEEENEFHNRKQRGAGSNSTFMTFSSKRRRVLTVIGLSLASYFQFCKSAKEACSFLHALLRPLKEKSCWRV